MQLLQLQTREDRGWTVVEVAGQVDVVTAPRLRQALIEAQYGGATDVVVDLDGVEFLDSFGLGVLVGALKRARSHAAQLVLVCSRERTRQLFTLTGLDAAFRLADTQETVLGPAR